VVFVVPRERHRALKARLKNLLCVPFFFFNKGSHLAVYEPEAPTTRHLAQERSLIYA
jgi:hypothetical protein